MKPGLRIVEASSNHAHLVSVNMRERDRAEVFAGWGKRPKEAILECLSASHYAMTLFYNLEVLCIFGVTPLTALGSSGQVWCFGTTAVDRHPFVFARASRRLLPELFRQAPILSNLVDATDERALRWLAFLGATYVLEPRPRGGRLFGQFILARERPPESSTCQQV